MAYYFSREMLESLSPDMRALVLESYREFIRIQDGVRKELKKSTASVVAALAAALGSGTFRKVSRGAIDEAREALRESLSGVFQNSLRGVVEAGMDPARKPLLFAAAEAKLGNDLLRIEIGFQRKALRVFERTWEYERYGRTLSARIWDITDSNMKSINQILSSGYGEDVKHVAEALTQYVKEGARTLSKQYPNMMARMAGRIPGNLNYEALRLARTELASAYLDAAKESYRDNPAVRAGKWLLSNTHPIPDVCDEYATADYYGLGSGVFPIDELPSLPHPNCLCCTAPVTIEHDELVSELTEWLDGGRVIPEMNRLLEA